LLCFSLLFLWACGDDDADVIQSGTGVRTVLVYIAADNTLSSFATDDFNEMKQGMLQVTDKGMHLVVYMDKKSGSPCLYELVNQGGAVSEQIIKSYDTGRNSMGVAEMKEVFSDVFSNKDYQASSYGLVIWSHGDGWIPYPVPSSSASTRWIGQDTNGGTVDNRMNLDDFVSVMQTAPHIDFLMFDACFMFSVEVAYALRNYADYLIASPTETPGPGAPYDVVVPCMFSTSDAAVKMATVYFNAYEAIYNSGIGISNDNWTGGTSIGVVDESCLASLAQGIKDAVDNVLSQDEDAAARCTDVASLRQSVFNYDQRDNKTYASSHIGYYDMADLMQQLLGEDYSPTVLSTLQSGLVYWQTTPMNYSQFTGMFSMEGTNGLTHYIPADLTSDAAEAYRSTAWYSAAGLDRLGW
ncbi:MAG: clostripain-related cysteine peptidase, partial [Prevotellaceae bacterium]|nr:clostripain-related cysteine peptidase [Prevotellaceae bacterium]